MKYIQLSFFLVIILCSSFKTLNQGKYYVRTIVIDAGHGGHDPGCKHGNLTEKEICLNIALKLGRTIEENLKDVRVVYTREKDEFVELYERAAIANRNNADVFISIHVNSAGNVSAMGTETYVMGLHRSSENLAVAKRENSVILLEDDFEKHYDGFDPNSPQAHIVFSLFQNAHLEHSLLLASKIEDQFKNRVRRNSRGVKQAGFLVLWRTTMPAVLVETGFITNANDRSFLTSNQGQEYIASAIFRAFRDYKESVELASK